MRAARTVACGLGWIPGQQGTEDPTAVHGQGRDHIEGGEEDIEPAQPGQPVPGKQGRRPNLHSHEETESEQCQAEGQAGERTDNGNG